CGHRVLRIRGRVRAGGNTGGEGGAGDGRADHQLPGGDRGGGASAVRRGPAGADDGGTVRVLFVAAGAGDRGPGGEWEGVERNCRSGRTIDQRGVVWGAGSVRVRDGHVGAAARTRGPELGSA